MSKSSLPVRYVLQNDPTNSTVDDIDDVAKESQQPKFGRLRHGGTVGAEENERDLETGPRG